MKCAEVTWDMRDENTFRESHVGAEVGDLLWNPKMPEGHVLVAEVRCGEKHNGRTVDCGCGGWGSHPCPSTSLVCECGEDNSWRDHHYYLLAHR